MCMSASRPNWDLADTVDAEFVFIPCMGGKRYARQGWKWRRIRKLWLDGRVVDAERGGLHCGGDLWSGLNEGHS